MVMDCIRRKNSGQIKSSNCNTGVQTVLQLNPNVFCPIFESISKICNYKNVINNTQYHSQQSSALSETKIIKNSELNTRNAEFGARPYHLLNKLSSSNNHVFSQSRLANNIELNNEFGLSHSGKESSVLNHRDNLGSSSYSPMLNNSNVTRSLCTNNSNNNMNLQHSSISDKTSSRYQKNSYENTIDLLNMNMLSDNYRSSRNHLFRNVKRNIDNPYNQLDSDRKRIQLISGVRKSRLDGLQITSCSTEASKDTDANESNSESDGDIEMVIPKPVLRNSKIEYPKHLELFENENTFRAQSKTSFLQKSKNKLNNCHKIKKCASTDFPFKPKSSATSAITPIPACVSPYKHKILRQVLVKRGEDNFDICKWLYLNSKPQSSRYLIKNDSEIFTTQAISTCPEWAKSVTILASMFAQNNWNPLSVFGSAPPEIHLLDIFNCSIFNRIDPQCKMSHKILRKLISKGLIPNSESPMSEEVWKLMSQFLKKSYDIERDKELDWQRDPLEASEVLWYLFYSGYYVDKTDMVAKWEVCFCPSPNPLSRWGWNDSRHQQRQSKRRLYPNLSICRMYVSPNK